MKKLIVSLLLMFCVNTYAAGRVGNGGDVVVCRNGDQITSVELLDFYEARVLRKIPIDLGPSSLSYEQKLKYVFNRLRPVDSYHADKFYNESLKFFDQAQFIDNIDLVDIPDSDHLFLPSGCKVEQIVIQRTPEFPEDKKFIVNNNLWQHLNTDNRVGLTTHENIYSAALADNQENSVKTRYLNSMISSTKINTMKAVDAFDLIKRVFNSDNFIGYQNYVIAPDHFYPNGNVEDGALQNPIDVQWRNNILKAIDRVSFFDDGTLKSMGSQNYFKISILHQGKNLVLNCGTITFWRSGDYHTGCSTADLNPNNTTSIPFFFQGKEIKTRLGARIDLFSDGSLQSFTLYEDTELRLKDGKSGLLQKSDGGYYDGIVINADQEGNVIKGYLNKPHTVTLLHPRHHADVEINGAFEFYANGNIKIASMQSLPLDGHMIPTERAYTIFYESGLVKEFFASLSWVTNVQGMPTLLLDHASLYENGKIKSAFSVYPIKLMDAKGNAVNVQGDFCLDENEKYISSTYCPYADSNNQQ